MRIGYEINEFNRWLREIDLDFDPLPDLDSAWKRIKITKEQYQNWEKN